MCDCLTKVNEALKENYENAEIKTAFTFPDMNVFPVIEFEYNKSGKKRKVTQNLIPTYCPFCGVKYDKKKAAQNCD